uniref:Uncharacterized protein n=1 Tax=Romanomermis culicivorax TaxID=13658 RepID=A0A915I1M2_ROMCU
MTELRLGQAGESLVSAPGEFSNNRHFMPTVDTSWSLLPRKWKEAMIGGRRNFQVIYNSSSSKTRELTIMPCRAKTINIFGRSQESVVH